MCFSLSKHTKGRKVSHNLVSIFLFSRCRQNEMKFKIDAQWHV